MNVKFVSYHDIGAKRRCVLFFPPLYGDGKAPRKILEAVVVRTSSIFCQHVRFGARKEI
jgi:hypothetical protein